MEPDATVFRRDLRRVGGSSPYRRAPRTANGERRTPNGETRAVPSPAESLMPVARRFVIVYHPGCLHERISDRRTDKSESLILAFFC
jgi:hypothetical protein